MMINLPKIRTLTIGSIVAMAFAMADYELFTEKAK